MSASPPSSHNATSSNVPPHHTPTHDPLRLVWCAPIYEATGYADEARGILTALDAASVPVVLRPVQERQVPGFREQLAPNMARALAVQERRQAAPPFVLVEHFLADGFVPAPAADAVVGRTMFETDALPPDWVAACNRMDMLWVPSAFNVHTFRSAGVTTPLRVVPGGIDCERFTPHGPALSIPGARGAVFLSVFEWRQRKGWDVLLQAWADTFAAHDDVTLVLRTYIPGLANTPEAADLLNTLVDTFLREQCGRERHEVAPIVVLADLIGEHDLPALYRAADVYVSPTRGEGWGRPFMEAMACAKPVIATRWSAHLSFMTDANSVLVDIDGLVPAHDPEVPIYRDTRWAAPSVAHLRESMRRLGSDPEHRRQIGERARADMIAHWGWAHAASAVETHMAELARTIGASRATPAVETTRSVVWSSAVFEPATASRAQRAMVAALAPALASYDIGVRAEHSATAVRPPLHDALTPVWHDTQRALTSTPALTITWCDATSVRGEGLAAPASGRWVLCSGDLTPAAWRAMLNNVTLSRVVEFWVSSRTMAEALTTHGVPDDHIMVCDTWHTVTDDEWSAMYVLDDPETAASETPRVFLPVFTTEDVAGAELVMRLWPRVAPSNAELCLRVARDAVPAVHAWCEQTQSRLSASRGPHVSVAWMSGAQDSVVAHLRRADVLVVPSDSVYARAWCDTQCELGGALIVPDTHTVAGAASDKHTSAVPVWRIPAGPNGTMSGAALGEAIRLATAVRTLNDRVAARVAYRALTNTPQQAAAQVAERMRRLLLPRSHAEPTT